MILNLYLIIFVSVILILSLISFSVKIYPFVYHKILKPKYDKSYTPSVAIFIPCKGTIKHFSENVLAFTKIEYPSYRLFFVVEDEKDAAYHAISKVIDGKENASLIVAGISEKCGQKNHNLLKAIESSGEKDDIYVFFDDDVPVNESWLRNLILPLSDKNVSVSTGFRCMKSSRNTFGEMLHSWMVNIQWSLINFFPFKGLWGGSMAIRREDFERLNVKENWRKTVVDDMTLENIVIRKGKATVLVLDCVTQTDDAIVSKRKAFSWFKRQSLYIKYYLRPLWFVACFTYVFTSLHVILLPVALASLLIFTDKDFYPLIQIASFTTVFTTIFIMIWATLNRYSYKDGHNNIAWFLLSPILMIITATSTLASGFTSVMRWSGIHYHLDFFGNIKKINR